MIDPFIILFNQKLIYYLLIITAMSLTNFSSKNLTLILGHKFLYFKKYQKVIKNYW